MYKLFFDQKLAYRFLRHGILFLSMVGLFTWVAVNRSDVEESLFRVFTSVLSNALVFFTYAYLTVYLLIPVFLLRRRIIFFILTFLLSGMLLSLVKLAFSGLIFYQAIAPESAISGSYPLVSAMLVNTKDMSFIVAVFALVKYARDYFLLDANNRELQRKELEAELKLIEHQLDPHVIFNNLNNLYSISINRPEILKENLSKLHSLMQYLFRESKTGKVPLEREVRMIRNYVGLEKLRFGDRLEVEMNTSGHFQGLEITPLVLYSFVENCFVHGAGEEANSSWIRIDLEVNDSRLNFRTFNSIGTGQHESESQRGTAGNSARRLELAYPNAHRLRILEKANEYQVELSMIL